MTTSEKMGEGVDADVLIVGGGPAGMSAALVLARACRRVTLIDAGKPRNSVTLAIHGFLTRDGISPQELRDCGRLELTRYGVEILDDSVTDVKRLSNRESERFPTWYSVRTEAGRMLESRKLLIATGQSDQLPELPGLRECYGVSVHHCPYCDGWGHRGERLLAYGQPADRAAKLGLALRSWSEHVTVLTGGESLDSSYRERLKRHGIQVREEVIVRIVAENRKLRGIELEGSGLLPAEALFFQTIQQPARELLRSLGIPFASDFAAQSDQKQRTIQPGLFLAGDIDGDVEFAIVAAGEGATAAAAMNRELLEEDLR